MEITPQSVYADAILTAGMTLAFQYVHELQHLFRLAGMKKEIVL